MAIEVELPDGSVAEFPDGTPHDVMVSAISQRFPPSSAEAGPTPTTEGPSALDEAKRGLSMGSRSVLEGAGAILDPIYAPLNAISTYFGRPDLFQNPGKMTSDAIGLATPQNAQERLASDIQRGAASFFGGAGLGTALNAAGKAPGMANMLKTMPGTQIAAGAGAGLGAGAAREADLPPAAQMGAGLIGGTFAPAAGVGVVGAGRMLGGAKTALESFTPAGQNRIAGQTLNRMATSPEAVKSHLAEGMEDLVPGSRPTLAQASGDSGLAVMEKAMASNSGERAGELQARYLEQTGAREAAMRETLDARAPFGGTTDAESAGGLFRDAFDKNYNSARERTREAYAAIDPAGTSSFAAAPLAREAENAVSKFFGPGGGEPPAEIASVLEYLQQAARQGTDPPVTLTGNTTGIVGRLNQSVADALPGGKAGDIRLTQASADAINKKHGEQIRNLGFKNAEDFVSHVLGNMDAVYPTRGAYDLLTRRMSPYGKAIVESRFEPPPGLYETTSAFPVRDTAYKNKSPLWERAPSSHSAPGSGTPSAVSGQSGFTNSINPLAAGGNGLSFQALQNLRSRLSEAGNKAAMAGERRAASASGQLKSAIDDMIGNSAEQGFSPEQAALYKRAQQARSDQGSRFESGANKGMTLSGNTLEGERIASANVPANYFQHGENGGESMRAFKLAMGDSPEAMRVMKDYVVAKGRAAATKPDGALDLNKLTTWTRQNRPALKELGLSDLADMQKIRADIKRAKEAESRAAVKGSPTMQNFATDAVINRVLGGSKAPASNGALSAIASGAGRIPRIAADVFMQPNNEAVRNILMDSMLDPELALKLMQNAKQIPRESLLSVLGNAGKGTASALARLGAGESAALPTASLLEYLLGQQE